MDAEARGGVFERLFRGAADALLVSDAQGRCVDANVRALEVWGLPRERLVGCPISELLALKGLGAGNRHVLPSGEALLVVRDAHGPSRVQFEFMVERTNEEIYLVRADGSIAYANEAAARSVGYSRAELLALGVPGIDPDYGPRFTGHLETLRGSPGQVFETIHLTRDGRRLRKEIQAVYLALDGADYVCAFGRDITERARSAGELRQVSRLYALLSQVNHAMVHVKDRASLLDSTCRAAIEFGFHMAWAGLLDANGVVVPVAQAGQVEGYLDEMRIDTHDAVLAAGPVGRAARDGQLDVCADIAAEPRMLPWQKHALARGYLSLAAVPLRQQGKIVGALTLYAAERGFFSERECQLLRQVGDDLSFAFDVLAGTSERDRLREQLDRSRKLESLGRLAGGVAHDFNNLLTVILGGLEEAVHLLGPQHPAGEPLQDSLEATRRSTELTRQLLTIARKQHVSPRVLDLNACVESSLKLLPRLLGEDVTVRWQPGAGVGPVRADPTQLDQVLINLCQNARDALSPGGSITVSTANAPGDLVSLVVADDGSGMSPEVQAHLFEPFFTTKPHGRGTGLGLSTVYGIVQQAGGSISVDSAPGRGSTFTISLPRIAG